MQMESLWESVIKNILMSVQIHFPTDWWYGLILSLKCAAPSLFLLLTNSHNNIWMDRSYIYMHTLLDNPRRKNLLNNDISHTHTRTICERGFPFSFSFKRVLYMNVVKIYMFLCVKVPLGRESIGTETERWSTRAITGQMGWWRMTWLLQFLRGQIFQRNLLVRRLIITSVDPWLLLSMWIWTVSWDLLLCQHLIGLLLLLVCMLFTLKWIRRQKERSYY